MTMKAFLGALALGPAAVPPLHAIDLSPWGEAGPCQIMVGPNHDNSCLAQLMSSAGSFMRPGLHERGKTGFLAVLNLTWPEAKLNQRYTAAFRLDEGAFTGDARGVEIGKDRGLQVICDGPAFPVDLARKRVMTMAADGVDLGTFDPAGSGEAVKAVLACQAEQGRSRSADPFRPCQRGAENRSSSARSTRPANFAAATGRVRPRSWHR
jgi:hypothetical protein